MIMTATTIKTDSKSMTIQVDIPIPSGTGKMGMLEREEFIQQGINQAGLLATEYALSQFDSDGFPIKVDGKKYTSKGQVSKAYQTPYGEVVLFRHVYQTNAGGATFCPLDNDARIITGSTPKLAKMVSSKYSESGASQVQKDLEENHSRHLSKQYIQSLSQSTGSLITEKKNWNYTVDVSGEDVAVIVIGVEGVRMLLCNDGHRMVMVGSISLYDTEGENLYTRYTALPSEDGKEAFYQAFGLEIKRIHKLYPNAQYAGISDGDPDNVRFLQPHTEEQVIDFFQAVEYLSKVSKAAFTRSLEANAWFESVCHTLKNEEGGAALVLKKMKSLLKKRTKDEKREVIKSSITYFTKRLHQMDYYTCQQKRRPVATGGMEAAGEVIVKQRFFNSGMKWTDNGIRTVLSLRCFNKSDGMWEQFWNKVNRCGK